MKKQESEIVMLTAKKSGNNCMNSYEPVEILVAQIDKLDNFYLSLGRLPKTVEVAQTLFSPERSFFVGRSIRNSRSIPVIVAAGKAVNPECRAGVGRHLRPPATCHGAATKRYEDTRNICVSEDSEELLTNDKDYPFFGEKAVASLIG